MKLSLINAIGCAILLGMAATQWVKHEDLRKKSLQQQKQTHLISQQRDEAQEKINALQTDILDLKRAIEETQKAAETASQTALTREEQLNAATATVHSLQTERDALQARAVEWANAISQRDAAITKLNTDLIALRKKLDEAIVQLTKAGAR